MNDPNQYPQEIFPQTLKISLRKKGSAQKLYSMIRRRADARL